MQARTDGKSPLQVQGRSETLRVVPETALRWESLTSTVIQGNLGLFGKQHEAMKTI